MPDAFQDLGLLAAAFIFAALLALAAGSAMGYAIGRQRERQTWLDAAARSEDVRIDGQTYAVLRILQDELDFSGADEFPGDGRP